MPYARKRLITLYERPKPPPSCVFPPITHLVGDRSTGFPSLDDPEDFDEFDQAEFEREQRDAMFDSADFETIGSGPNGEWTDADEAGLEEYEIAKRERIALANEY